MEHQSTSSVSWIIGVVFIALFGGLAYWLARPAPVTPASISVVTPAGGEEWLAGSTQTIRWQTSGVPASHKVSVTIRRLPPPPLREEGQEFDPIIYTDLPNTGSASWTISSMYPVGTYVLGLTSYEKTPVTAPVSAESAPFTLAHPALAGDLLPLYSGVSWNASIIEDVTIGTTSYSGASVSSAAVEGTMDPAGVFSPFEKYYDKKLKALGWQVVNELAAGGHVGGQTGYRKGAATALVRFRIDYHTVSETAPSECPCDVTLSLFSSP